MNIYTILMGKDKNQLNLPQISNSSRKPSLILKKPKNSLKESKNYSVEHASYRKTYDEIIRNNQVRIQLKKKKEQQKQITSYKKTFNSTFVKINKTTKVQLSGFTFIREIGKGGFAQVYEYQDQNKRKVAIKEYLLQNSFNCFNNQIIIGQYFFKNGSLKDQFTGRRGSDNLIAYRKKIRFGKKGLIVQQIGGKPLSKMVQDIQGTFHKGQRVYQITFSEFHKALKQKNLFINMLKQLISGLQFFNNQGFLHCDIKPDNILIKWDEKQQITCKIIDFGSAFQYDKNLPKITITPQYMPPELLQAIDNDAQNTDLRKVDIWSFGCILLQILTGIPLWFRYKCKFQMKGKQILGLGYFALTNREYPKIIKKQKQLCSLLNKINFVYKEFESFRKVLKRVLVIDPQKRATHQEIISLLQTIQ